MTYYIYHIEGVKIGCTTNPKYRVKYQQNHSNWEILEEHSDIYIASEREIELQKQYGYKVDKTPYYKMYKIRQIGATTKTRSKGGKISGKISGKICYEKQIGIFGLSKEERSIITSKAVKMGGKVRGKMNVLDGTLAKARKISAEKRCKPILVYDLMGNFISNYKSTSEAANELNIHSAQICSVLKGREKQAKGYIFKYA